MSTKEESKKNKALDLAVGQIDKQFGKGSIMRLGEDSVVAGLEGIPTGAISLDSALGIGGVPRGRITEIYGPEASGKTTLARSSRLSARYGRAGTRDLRHACPERCGGRGDHRLGGGARPPRGTGR